MNLIFFNIKILIESKTIKVIITVDASNMVAIIQIYSINLLSNNQSIKQQFLLKQESLFKFMVNRKEKQFLGWVSLGNVTK